MDTPSDDWQRIVSTSLVGTMQVTQAVLPHMIHMASLAGKEGLAKLSAYSAASAGVIAFTKALSREVIGHDVFVNCVAPGPIDTDMIRGLDVGRCRRGDCGQPHETARLGRRGRASCRLALYGGESVQYRRRI